MKKMTLLIVLLATILISFAQKSEKNGFLKFKVPKGWSFEAENPNEFWLHKNENENVVRIFSSQTTNLKKHLEIYLCDTTSGIKVKTVNYEYIKYTGYNNSDKKEGVELYLYNKENIYIAIVKLDNTVNEQVFVNFLNSIEIDEKITKWKTYENDLFSINLPDLVVDSYISENLREITYYVSEEPYFVNIYVSDYYSPKVGYIPNSNSVKFSKNIYGEFYTIDCFDENNSYISKEFYDKVKANFKPKNNQPPSNVIPISGGSTYFQYNCEGQPWEFFCIIKKGKLSFWNLLHNNIVYNSKKLTVEPTSITTTNNGEYLFLANAAGSIQVLNDELRLMDDVELQKHKAKINQIKYVEDIGLVTCSDDKTLLIQSTDFYENEAVIICKGHKNAVTCFDGNSKILISGSKDNSIIIWNKKGEIKSTHNIHSDDITAIQILDNKIVISASKDNVVKIWDFTSGEILKTINIDNGYVTCFNDKTESSRLFNKYFAMGTSSGEIIVVETKSYEITNTFKDDKPIKLIRFYQYNRLITVNNDNKVKYWQPKRDEK